MATTMKSNDSAIQVIQQMLQERVLAEPEFAVKLANPSKSLEGAVNFLCHTVQKSGMTMLDNVSVMNIICDYYYEADIEESGHINCNIVVSKPELSEEDKDELKAQAMEQYKQEQIQAIRREATAKATSKPRASAPKAGQEINVEQGNLFGENF